MKLYKLLIGAVLATLTIYGAVAFLVVKIVDEVDNNGGLKGIVERVWEGNKK